MDKELNAYLEKRMMDLEENPTRTLYMSVITEIIYIAIKLCIGFIILCIGFIILYAIGLYLGVW